MADSNALSGVLAELRAALEGDPARAEKPDERFRLMRRFEQVLATLSTLPDAAIDDDRTGKVATLLWQKAHPDKANLDDLLVHISDDDAWVRATAAAALATSLVHRGPPSGDDRTRYRTRIALERQRYREPSRAIAFQLEELLNEVQTATVAELPPALAAAPRNPYVAGPPVRNARMFFGREDVLDALRRALGQGVGTRGVVVQGGRRTGKTSLLYRIRDGALGSAFLPVYFDMQSVVGKPLEQFLGALVHAVVQAAGEKDATAIDAPADFDGVRRAVGRAIASNKDRLLVLMFDEYEVFKDYLRDGGVARQLQSLLEQEQALIFIFAGAQKVESLKERHFQLLLDDCTSLKISFLSPAVAKRLVIDPAAGTITFPDAVADQIVALTAGHPFYIQALCHVIFDEVQQNGGTEVSAEDVERAVLRFVENPAPHLVLGWNALPLDQKVATSALAMRQDSRDDWVAPEAVVQFLVAQRYPIRVGTSEMHEALAALREDDWVSKRDGDRTFRTTMELVRRWIVEHRPIWELVREQRSALISRTAGLDQRAWALVIDLAAIGVLSGALSPLVDRVFFGIALAYPIGSLLTLGASPGMLAMRIKVLSEVGVPLHPLRSILLGLFGAAPLLLFGAAVLEVVGRPARISLMLAALGIVVLHGSMVHMSRKKRGLFDKLAGAVFVLERRE
jgi:uncharacterized RDD family membrane protein YckC